MKAGKNAAGKNGRTYGAFALTVVRRFLCALAALLLIAAAAAGSAETAETDESAGPSWEERLEAARLKYNAKTVNIYKRGKGAYRRWKINVCFYPSGNKPYVNINIRESLRITDEAEMHAILELITENENYNAEEYGTISFMKAQWIAHNLAHSMATGTDDQKRLIEAIAGESLSDILGSSKELDLSQYGNMTSRQQMLYEIIEFAYGLNLR